MNDLINFITQGSETFTPSVIVGIIVFCMIFDSLMMVLGNAIKGVRK